MNVINPAIICPSFITSKFWLWIYKSRYKRCNSNITSFGEKLCSRCIETYYFKPRRL